MGAVRSFAAGLFRYPPTPSRGKRCGGRKSREQKKIQSFEKSVIFLGNSREIWRKYVIFGQKCLREGGPNIFLEGVEAQLWRRGGDRKCGGGSSSEPAEALNHYSSKKKLEIRHPFRSSPTLRLALIKRRSGRTYIFDQPKTKSGRRRECVEARSFEIEFRPRSRRYLSVREGAWSRICTVHTCVRFPFE